jgi:hypothetical protein
VVLKVFLVILDVSRSFWSFCRFGGSSIIFGVYEDILVILDN